MPLHKLINQTA